MATHISIDVDQTILDDDGQLLVGVQDGLKLLKNAGMTLQLWSKGGAEYARETADKFKLTEFFTSYAAKPDISIDDLPEDAHPVCTLGVPFADAVRGLNLFVADSIETTLCPGRAVVDLVQKLQKKKRTVERDYGQILRRNKKGDEIRTHHPISFFGNLESAQILTIGLNPSSTEFEAWRHWPDNEMDADLLARRLASYFRSVQPRPHPWFGELQEALAIIGGNYKVNAAHVDLSPWSTLSPRKLSQMSDRENLLACYNKLLKLGQEKWLPQVIEICKRKVKLLLIVDKDKTRAEQTKAICESVLGTQWEGHILILEREGSVKYWAWENKDAWARKVGANNLLD
jgi:hypothetical protein